MNRKFDGYVRVEVEVYRNLNEMAKYIAQLIIAGSQVVGRAFARAIKQEIEASQQAAQRLGNTKTRSERIANQKLGLSLEEAKQILNVKNLSKEEIEERYHSLFKANEKTSLYLQSKIVRAKERLDHELVTSESSKSEKLRDEETVGKT
ncbi:mitochondrial import inner membrane translocase subunit tim16 [Leptinotarsa decemlineata]|uniref:mitochondrial import inner membrane translocase subunit tim16 n=1 Tax=Leptinotarsa decemlineata TaxID=7539 RepID=UPI000C255086|nr:mitochondrial import inner membrane translocase subunit tim16-like [Leptinotarsa decemlineata]